MTIENPKIKHDADEAVKNSLKWLSLGQMITLLYWRVFVVYKIEYFVVQLFRGYAVPIAFKRAKFSKKHELKRQIELYEKQTENESEAVTELLKG